MLIQHLPPMGITMETTWTDRAPSTAPVTRYGANPLNSGKWVKHTQLLNIFYALKVKYTNNTNENITKT